MREIRLLPLVIVAVGALFALKEIGILFGEGPIIGGSGPAMAQQETATEEANTEDPPEDRPADAVGAETANADGETASEQPQEASVARDEEDERSFLDRVLGSRSRSRDALMDNLAERRKQLEARGEELDLRENLLKAAEQRVEKRITELRELEARLSATDAERKQEDEERMKGVVTMYESMKPKDAARIFNDLDMEVVVKVASRMSARQMSAVLAEMESVPAQQLTLALSADPADPANAPQVGGDLPQIVGTRPAN